MRRFQRRRKGPEHRLTFCNKQHVIRQDPRIDPHVQHQAEPRPHKESHHHHRERASLRKSTHSLLAMPQPASNNVVGD